jgi:2,4-diketo-3-deoxy-L-fuconate hydrolase
MRLYTFEISQQRRLGADLSGQLVDLSVAYDAFAAAQANPPALRAIPSEMSSFVRLGTIALEAATQTLNYIRKRPAIPVGAQLLYPFEAVRILAPLRPGKIVCSGIGREEGAPTEPLFFAKLPNTVIGPNEAIINPKVAEQLDAEGSLGVVIGKRMKAVAEAEVMSSIFGCTILHDISARGLQIEDRQVMLAKNFDTFCPLGPCVVTADELAPENMRMKSILNGNLARDDTIANWMLSLPRLLGILSRVMTLEPGDIVSASTPAGTGVPRRSPVQLKSGDLLSLEIDGIGRLENPIMAGE